jgi:thioredoxin 1
MGQHALSVTDADFKVKVLEAPLPTLVDFWAEWCGPCRQLAPVVSAIAERYQGRLQVAKMDIDANPKTPTTYAVRAIPTLVLIKDGQVVEQLVGLVSKTKLEEVISRHL